MSELKSHSRSSNIASATNDLGGRGGGALVHPIMWENPALHQCLVPRKIPLTVQVRGKGKKKDERKKERKGKEEPANGVPSCENTQVRCDHCHFPCVSLAAVCIRGVVQVNWPQYSQVQTTKQFRAFLLAVSCPLSGWLWLQSAIKKQSRAQDEARGPTKANPITCPLCKTSCTEQVNWPARIGISYTATCTEVSRTMARFCFKL